MATSTGSKAGLSARDSGRDKAAKAGQKRIRGDNGPVRSASVPLATRNAEKPVSLAPLSPEEALRALFEVKP